MRKIAALLTAPVVEPAPVVDPPPPPPRLVLAAADRDAIVAAMPPTARELVDVIGFDETIKVLRNFGGKRLFVPAKLIEGNSYKLVEELGREIAEKLVDAMGGTRLEPPMIASVARLLRDNAIRSDYDRMCADGEQCPMDRLVDRYQVTQRHIRKVLKASMSTAPRQRPPQQRHDIYTMPLFSDAAQQHQQQGAFA